jgi:hypothetical protein
MRVLRAVSVVLAALLLLPAAPAAADGSTADRLYLLNAPGDTAYYSTDPSDPEATGGSLSQRCNIFLNPTTTRLCQFTFMPAVQLEAPLTWSPSAPLRFHAELTPQAPADFTVTFFVQSGTSQFETPAATQVSPGVWEAELTAAGAAPLNLVTGLGVRVRATGPTVAMVLRTRGRSWVDLGRAVPAKSVPQLLAQSPVATDPNTYTTRERTFRFADRSWTAWQFSGDLRQNRTFDLALPTTANALYAWIEHDDGPALRAVAGGRTPDARWLSDVPSVRIMRGGTPIGDGGGDSRAAMVVPAGPLQIAVDRSPAAQDKPYVVHVVAVHGERTLQSLRWRANYSPTVQAGIVAACPHTFEPLVVPAAVSTFSVGVSWSSLDPTDRFALAYDIPTVGSVVCGNNTTDTAVRFVVPRAARLWLFEPRITTQQPNASAYDVEFEFEANLAYAP